MRSAALWLVVFFLFITPAFAEEPSTYAPEFCEFSIEFPSEPYTTRRCEDDAKSRCYDLVSYTQVFDLTTTVNFQVICNPVLPDIVSYYGEDVMKDTLRLMSKDNQLQSYETSFRQDENYKQAGLVGETLVGRSSGIYIAQLWVGQSSLFSVEAELIGEAHGKADQLFSDILKTAKFKISEEQNESSESESSPPSQKNRSGGSDSDADPARSP